MNWITAYYRFEKLPNSRSAYRLDCVEHSLIPYHGFSELRNKKGELFVYFGNSQYTKAGQSGRTELAISGRNGLISSIFVGKDNLNFGYGDFKGSSDALLFNLEGFTLVNGKPVDGAALEVFVVTTYAHKVLQLFRKLCNGNRNVLEMLDKARSSAVYEKVPAIEDGDMFSSNV